MMNTIKTVWKQFTSMKVTALLLVIFAVAIAAATFIENDYGVETSWALIYKAKWFEIVQVLLALNLVGSIFKFNMFQKKKAPILIFHIAFLVILVGAGMTRYLGYEGMMNIREGATENRMVSSDAFLQVEGLNDYAKEHIYLSALGENEFSHTFELSEESLHVELTDFIRKAAKSLKKAPDGVPSYELVISTPYGPETYYLQDKKVVELGYLNIYFNKKPDPTKPYIYIYTKEGKNYFISNYSFAYQVMEGESKGDIEVGKPREFTLGTLYYGGGFQMVNKSYEPKGKINIYSKYRETASLEEQLRDTNTPSALFFDVTYNGKTKEVVLMGLGKGYQGFSENVSFGDKNFSLVWGSRQITLPFALKLNDFIIEKYPGSKSPSSYESKVTLIDTRANIKEERRIYMNHTLTHGGYTFFQSSFDKDEKGTVLSVNHDPGKWPTYLGYFLLTVGLLLNLVNPSSRFFKLAKTKYIRSYKKTAALFVAFLFALAVPSDMQAYSNMANGSGFASVNKMSQEEIASFVKKIDKDHAALFGRVLVQDNGGRIEPMNTMAIDMINKVARGPILELNHEQMLLGMMTQQYHWQRLKMFKVKHPRIKEILGIPAEQNKFAYSDIFSVQGEYKLTDDVEDAIRRKPGNRGTFEKELIKLDERLNVAYMIYSGMFFKVFPLEGTQNNKWYTPSEVFATFPQEKKSEIENILRLNFEGVSEGYTKGDWSKANEAVHQIISYQKANGGDVLPPAFLIEAEMLYNKLALFEKLFPVYLLSGLMLFFAIFARLIKPNLNITWVTKIVIITLSIGFIAHTMNLGLRWYVAGHAPWSNSYEAMLYIAWTIILSGIVFAKQSEFALATTGIFSGITLFVAHLSWLDPQITNLVPVLKSYWLTIHVSVITASYGFLGLGAMLGFITLLLMVLLRVLPNEETKAQIATNIKEGTRINEISMLVGLTLLIIGNFLGGVWANESWGRYWGWDPKESWTLITVVIYALVLHLRYIPKLNTPYVLNAASLLSYSTVIMTYFGVNYYLSGLHSYASGDAIPIPTWLYVSTAMVFLMVIVSFWFRNEIANYVTEKEPEKRKEE